MKKSKYSYPAIFFIIAVIAAIFYYYMNKKEVFQIIPLDVVDHTDSTILQNGSISVGKSGHYFVTGFENYEKDINKIDSFICTKSNETDSIIKKIDTYQIWFFKKSDITNNEHLKAQERDLERYSKQVDLLCIYQWYNSNFLGRHDLKYKYVLDTLTCK